MSEDAPTYRPGRPGATGKAVLTRTQVSELRRLYSELPNAAAAARKALRIGGEPLTAAELEHFRECAARVGAIFQRLSEIIG
jgi:hypothetical protein